MHAPEQIQVRLDWSNIDTVLLDMDGTLLDKHFDDYFWEQFVPEVYALEHGGEIAAARAKLQDLYKSREGTLEWTDLDFWSRELDLDIPALKIQVNHLIQVHPYVIDFLDFCRLRDKKVYLVTNAHGKTLDIKMTKTALSGYFDRIVCAEEIGMAKENPAFWPLLRDLLDFTPRRTILADDTEAVLLSAQTYPLAQLIYVARPSSRSPVRYSARFPSIQYFKELME